MLTAAEREAVQEILRVAQEGEWHKGRCPRCGFEQLRGHKCSCPVKRAYKLLGRVVGQPEPGLEDDDLIVACAMSQLNHVTDLEGRKRILWDTVDAAMKLGARG